ncbi:MAG: hypothetical protein ACRD2R_00880, partial [Terriglobales bacterium]
CIANLPATGGTADARGLEGAQTISSDPFVSVTKPVVLLLGAATYSVTANVTSPTNIQVILSQGSNFSVATGVTLTIKGTLQAPLVRIFTLNGTGTVAFTDGLTADLHPEWWGAKGDGSSDDTTAIQSAVSALPGQTLSGVTNPVAYSRVLFTARNYKITSPISVANKNAVCLEGTSEGVKLTNTTSGSDLIRFNFGGSGGMWYPCVKRLTLQGTGTGSRAIYANATRHLKVHDVNAIAHPGPALYLESTNAVLTGAVFSDIQNLHAEPGTAVSAIYDKGGRSNVFKNVAVRVANIGFDIEDAIADVILGGYVESQVNGADKIGIRARSLATTDSTPGQSGVVRRTLHIHDTYFENNKNYAVDADRSYNVSMENIRGASAIDVSTPNEENKYRLDGGGQVNGFWNGSTAHFSSAFGIIRFQDAWGYHVKASQAQVDGVTFPIAPGGVNSASQSWADSNPSFTGAGTTPPTFAHDTGGANGFYGANSKKVTWPANSTSFTDSRARMDNPITASLVSGDTCQGYLVTKFSAANKPFELRLRDENGNSDVHKGGFLSETDWYIFAYGAKVDGAGTCSFWASPIADIGTSAVDEWFGGFAVAANAKPILVNTEWGARGSHDVDVQHLRGRTLEGITSITSPVFTSNSSDPGDSGVLRMGNNQSISWEASPPGTDITVKVGSDNAFNVSTDIAAMAGSEIRWYDPDTSNYFGLKQSANLTANYVPEWNLTGNCSALANGGALTINSSNQVVCSADDGGSGGSDTKANVFEAGVQVGSVARQFDFTNADDFSIAQDTGSDQFDISINRNAASGIAGLDAGSRIAKAQGHSATVYNDQANTYTAGSKQTLQNSATTAGLNLASSADPSAPAQGDLWLNASSLKWRGASSTFSAVPDSRTVSTSALLGGGGALSANLTLTCATCEVTTNKNAASGYAGLTAGTKLQTAQGQEVWAAADLTDYSGTSGTGATALRATITSPATNDVLTWSGTNWVNQAPTGGGGGDNITVSGSAATDANLSNTNPAAPSDGINVRFQLDTAANPDDISANVPTTSGGSAGIAAFNAGTASTVARSDHTHRTFAHLSWYFPGTPSTGVQTLVATLPDGIASPDITDIRVAVNTTSASSSSVNVQRCTASCTGTSPTFANIYSTDLSLAANTRTAAKGSAPNQNVSGLAAGDQFKVNLATIGASLSDVTVTMTYRMVNTN